MFRRLRETGPAALVPLAWGFATAAHAELLQLRTVRIGLLVMDALLVAFTVLSWRDMREGVLFAWKLVLVVGTAANLLATVAVFADPVDLALAAAAIVAWMLVPAVAYVYTGLRVERAPSVYFAGAVLSGLGTVAYLSSVGAPTLAYVGFALVGVGQTAGIVTAVRTY
ncbi:hypothetical protein [Haloarchaeobius sp. HRN-SO-5]|uniref:hypothetical protein n=1 Tax=Haloarchaeobius sp. HRN-SO-5 TaxID=3446118 RepID=UPI003EB6A5F5